ncbi:MAG: ATP synthase F1 subunit delta [Oscillospiraceae bacterium]
MGKLVDVYAGALLHYATEKGQLGPLFRQVCVHLGKPVVATDAQFSEDYVNDMLVDFLEYLKTKGRSDIADEILERFIELARGNLGITAVEVVSAVPLTEAQLADLQMRLIKRTRKQVQLLPRVDESLIAGLRLVGGGMVMDTSVKQQLNDMKDKIYRGVYFSK